MTVSRLVGLAGLVFLFLALVAPTAFAQTTITRGPLALGDRVVYEVDLQTAQTVQQAASFEARLNRNGAPLTAATTTSGLACVAAPAPATGFTCSWALTQSNLDALNQVGVHTLTATLFRADVGESPASAPFVLTTPGRAPTGLRITR